MTRLALIEDELGESEQAAALRAEVTEVDHRLETLLDDQSD